MRCAPGDAGDNAELIHGKPNTIDDGYPRPQLRRRQWQSLNGPWDFAIEAELAWGKPDQVQWDHTIQVPFAPETPASGIGDTGFFCACWYRREIEVTPPAAGERLILHFGAVDYEATVWVNDAIVRRHQGGYTPFEADITDFLVPGGRQTIVVRAEDDPQDLAKPRGKQDWQLEPHSIWYPRTTGIWQTVWIEKVPATHLRKLLWTPSLERWELGLEVSVRGSSGENLRLHATLRVGDHLIADDSYAVIASEVHRRIALSDPGIDDSRNNLLWSPAHPTIIEANLQLRGDDDELIDEVQSYTALRTVGTQGDKFVLNGRPLPLRMVLDQGYWPNTGQTPPDDEALRRDVELAKAMGFNGVRKHQKIEDPRYLYYADYLGLLVWEEMPSAYRYTRTSIERVTRQWPEAIERDSNHPCIIAWVPFNESWGVPDLPESPAQRHYVQALYHLTRTLDPTRPVVGNDGWESVATDIIGIHDYEDHPERLAKRYAVSSELTSFLEKARPSGRLLVLAGQKHAGQPLMLTEFGGIALSEDHEATWGYSRSENAREFGEAYAKLLAAIRSQPVLAGFCYTQFADTYQETNGLLYADRRPKIPLIEIALATRGPLGGDDDRQAELALQERLMSELAAAHAARAAAAAHLQPA